MRKLIDTDTLPYKLGVFDDGSQIIYVRAEDIQNAQIVISDDLIPHGKWLNEVEVRPHLYGWVSLTSVVCSACNTSSDKPSKFCPNCGAKMI